MKGFKILAAVIHGFGMLFTTMAIIIATVKLVPNNDAAWICVMILCCGVSATTVHFFLHNTEWYLTHKELMTEKRKFYDSNIELNALRIKYLKLIEKNSSKEKSDETN